MKKKKLVWIIFILIIGTNLIPIANGNIDQYKNNNSSLKDINVFGFFPRVLGDIIIYLSIYPFGWQTIYREHFTGSFGLTIIGIYNSSIPPKADFKYYPSEDLLRVKGNPFFFNSISTDLDGEIIEQWWRFNDTMPWIASNEPIYTFTESGYHNVSLRVVDNDGLNSTIKKRIRIYERVPTYQGIQGFDNITIVGYHVVGCAGMYNWSDFINVGSGSCDLPTNGFPNIGDVITNCSGLIVLQYIPNGVVSGSWYF